jgi:hypothetical protein
MGEVGTKIIDQFSQRLEELVHSGGDESATAKRLIPLVAGLAAVAALIWWFARR